MSMNPSLVRKALVRCSRIFSPLAQHKNGGGMHDSYLIYCSNYLFSFICCSDYDINNDLYKFEKLYHFMRSEKLQMVCYCNSLFVYNICIRVFVILRAYSAQPT